MTFWTKVDDLRFLLDGNIIYDSVTPASLEMENNDQSDVHFDCCGC